MGVKIMGRNGFYTCFCSICGISLCWNVAGTQNTERRSKLSAKTLIRCSLYPKKQHKYKKSQKIFGAKPRLIALRDSE
jgi:hypothetical protein